jgi:large subunit ribosomal protein L10
MSCRDGLWLRIREVRRVSKSREQKAESIEQLQNAAQNASIALVSDFRGLKVEDLEKIRNELKDNQIHYQVVKNTLARIAFKGTAHEVLNDQLSDCCAVAFGYDDPVIAAKVLVKHEKDFKRFGVKYGSYNGKFLDSDQIRELAKLPGREQLLSQMLCTMNAVPTNFVSVFANLLRYMLNALNGIKDQKEA